MKIVPESKRRQVCHFHLRNSYGASTLSFISTIFYKFITIFLVPSNIYNRKKISVFLLFDHITIALLLFFIFYFFGFNKDTIYILLLTSINRILL